jgi:Na+/H+ antiporter NhaD/arsenite permease-like protein
MSTVGENMVKVKEFFKNEIVLILSFVLAVISAFFVSPNKGYFEYIDFRTLGLLFCLMAVMAGLNSMGVFKLIAEKLLSKVKSISGLSLILGLLCFFSSMVITNDVALITFVPFTITALKLSGKTDKLIWIVTIETVAANLGSMLTPIGNPQNLYLFSAFNMSMSDFLLTILPCAMLSLVLVIMSCLIAGKGVINSNSTDTKYDFSKLHIGIYVALFVMSLLTVFRVIPCIVTVIITVATLLIFDRKTILKIDYSLLFTFVFLFIFIGNLGEIRPISEFLKSIVNGNEVIVGVISSQVFSNVPAAILLSKFTENAKDLLIGVNLGGLGTLIASMASLISFKFIAKEKVNMGKYILTFSFVNIVFLILNLGLWIIIK